MVTRTLQPKKISSLRVKAGLTQDQFAFRLKQRGFGTNAGQVHKWERGQQPRAKILPAIADVLGCTIDELYGDEDDEESDPVAVLDRAARALALHGEYQLAADLKNKVAGMVREQRVKV